MTGFFFGTDISLRFCDSCPRKPFWKAFTSALHCLNLSRIFYRNFHFYFYLPFLVILLFVGDYCTPHFFIILGALLKALDLVLFPTLPNSIIQLCRYLLCVCFRVELITHIAELVILQHLKGVFMGSTGHGSGHFFLL